MAIEQVAEYMSMVLQAAQLIEPDDTIHDNPEYIRGMCELIASVFPKRGLYTAERAKEVAKDMGIKQDIYMACGQRGPGLQVCG